MMMMMMMGSMIDIFVNLSSVVDWSGFVDFTDL